ncbi:MAG: tetratricopeptide repeat protein [Crocinitomicaceae bacterium]
MNTIKIKAALFCAMLATAGISTAQKSNEVNAAMEYQSFQKKVMSQDYESAKKALLDAKQYIDEAAADPSTIQSPKTLFYKGQIYLSIPALSSMMKDDAELKALTTDTILKQGVQSLKKSYELDTRKEYRDEISQFAEMGRYQAINEGIKQFKANDFKAAQEMFETSIGMFDIVGKTDSLAYYNAGLAADRQGKKEDALKFYSKCAEIGYNSPDSDMLTASLLRDLKRTDEALVVIKRGREKYPNDKGLLLELVNIDLSKGDNAAAEKSLTDAIAAAPDNKQLYFAIGSVYDKLEQPEKAVGSFKKALELDSMYEDAAYSLGAHYVNIGAKGKEAADALPFGDPHYDETIKKADAEYMKAIPYLEQAVRINPKNADVLNTLFQLYRKVGNAEKSAEYKAKYDALK